MHVGRFLKPSERTPCHRAAKLFGCIHEFSTIHSKRYVGVFKLSTLKKHMLIIRRMKPNLKEIHLFFNVSEFIQNEESNHIEKLFNGLQVTIEIKNSLAALDMVRFLNSCVEIEINELALNLPSDYELPPGFVECVQNSASKNLALGLYKRHASLLSNEHICRKINQLVLNTTYSNSNTDDEDIDLTHIPESCSVVVSSHGWNINISPISKIKVIAFFASDLLGSSINKFKENKDSCKIQDVVIWNIATVVSCDTHAWFDLAQVLPKTTRLHIHAGMRPNIIAFISALKKYIPSHNINVFYNSRDSFLNCKMLNLMMPDIVTSGFKLQQHWVALQEYTPLHDHQERLSTKQEIYAAMDDIQKYSWLPVIMM